MFILIDSGDGKTVLFILVKQTQTINIDVW